MNPQPKILLIEDDPGIAAGRKKELQSEGYQVTTPTRGDQGLAPHAGLSPGQAEEIARVYHAHPELNDDAFVRENLQRWLA